MSNYRSHGNARINWDLIRSIPLTTVLDHLGRSVNRSGAAHCPLPGHKDTNPSFHVYRHDNSWYCFACGLGGSVIDLAMHCMNMTPREAAMWLQKNYLSTHATSVSPFPVTVFNSSSPPKAKNTSSVAADSAILDWMLSFCTLTKAGRSYLRSRNFSNRTIDHFQIGEFGPIDKFVLEARQRWSEPALIQSGLLRRARKQAPVSCPYRAEQLIFPFFEQGKCVYFQVRRAREDSKIRWFNPPGLSVSLYNRDVLQTLGGRRTVYLCEGATDVMSAHELGWRAVGLVGVNSLKTEWLPSFRGLDVHILFDRDDAGQRRAKKYLALFQQNHISVVNQILPFGSDLNEFLAIRRRSGKR